MKITLKNFGPISNFEFDLEKDLHVIFGKNNIGKSYAITAIYLILKNFIEASNRRGLSEVEFFLVNRKYFSLGNKDSEIGKNVNEIEKNIIEKLKNKNVDELDISGSVISILTTLVNQVFVKNLENSFKNSFAQIDQLSNKYSKKKLIIIIEFKEVIIEIENHGDTLIVRELKIGIPIIIKNANTTRKPLYSDNKFVLYFNNKGNHIDIISDCIQTLYFNLKFEVSNLISNVYFLPASRSGLYQALNAFSAVMAELSKSRTFLMSKIEIPNISEPVSDYFLNLSNIKGKNKSKFNDIIEMIENEILKGKVLFKEENKKIIFSQNEINEEFELAVTSSMVSEIAPIVAYLKYIVTNDTNPELHLPYSKQNSKGSGLLFIEEPEAHLHPEIQVKLMEIFTKLVGKNLKIILTSHSNYMFNKLSNLILDNKINFNKIGSYIMRNTKEGSVTDAITMKAEADGINDENFADVAEQLYEERIKIYDKLNKTS